MHGIVNTPADRADKSFKCPFCSMSFKSKRGLQKHSEIKHDTEIEVEVENDIDMGTEVQTMEFIIASWYVIYLFIKSVPFKVHFFYYIKIETYNICQKLECISGKTWNSATRQFVKIEANISTKKAK